MTFIVTLDQLCVSPFNVRRNAEDTEATSALEASIAARGLIFPLLVHDMAPFRDVALPDEPLAVWGVLAGGRRLRAMRRLAAAGRMRGDAEIEVIVRDLEPAAIIELSLAENLDLLRRDLRPYEVHAAIRDAQDQGATDEEIAANLGQPIAWVRRQLRLGRLVPEIFDAYVSGAISGEQAQAFAATEDCDLQRAAWAHFGALRDWDRAPHRIHAWYKVGDNELAKLLRFVGAEDYRAAGGRFELDLFADGPERGRVSDEGVLRELAENKLAMVRQDIRRRSNRNDLRFAADPPQQHGSTDWSLRAEVQLGKAASVILPEGDIFATIDIDAAGDIEIRYWWANRKARKDAIREASSNGVQISPAAPVTSFGHAIEGAEAFDKYSTYAQAARQAVKDEHGLTADGLQVMRSLRRELLRALLLADAMNDGELGRDYLVWGQLRQEIGKAQRAPDIGARGLVSVGYGSEEAEPHDVVDPHLAHAHAHQMWAATLEHIQSMPFMTIEDPADAFASFHFESDRVKRVAAAILAGLSLLRSANVPGWRVSVHDRIADILGADDHALRELWQPTPAFMVLFPKLKRLELAQPFVDAEAFRDWHRQSDQVLTGACVGALEHAGTWVHPLLSFGVQADEVMTAQCEATEPEVAEEPAE